MGAISDKYTGATAVFIPKVNQKSKSIQYYILKDCLAKFIKLEIDLNLLF